MSEPPMNMSTLQRQRRFLMLMSLLVIAYYLLGASVKQEAEYNGFVIHLERPGLAVFGMWAIFLWAAFRYWQYGLQMFIHAWSQIRAAAHGRAWMILRATAARRAEANVIEAKAKTIPVDALITEINETKIPYGDGDPHGNRYIERPNQLPLLDIANSPVSFHVVFNWRSGARFMHGAQNVTLEVSRARIRFVACRAWVRTFFTLPDFSEHIAPIALFLGAVCSWLWATGRLTKLCAFLDF